MLTEKILRLAERGYGVTFSSDPYSETITIMVMKDRRAVRKVVTEEWLLTAFCSAEETVCMTVDKLIEEMEKTNG